MAKKNERKRKNSEREREHSSSHDSHDSMGIIDTYMLAKLRVRR